MLEWLKLVTLACHALWNRMSVRSASAPSFFPVKSWLPRLALAEASSTVEPALSWTLWRLPFPLSLCLCPCLCVLVCVGVKPLRFPLPAKIT